MLLVNRRRKDPRGCRPRASSRWMTWTPRCRPAPPGSTPAQRRRALDERLRQVTRMQRS